MINRCDPFLSRAYTILENNLRFFIILVFFAVLSGCASVQKPGPEDGFAERYHTYQALSQAGYASINKKDYKAAIDQYTQAIALSPFVASDYYYRGLAWFKDGNDEKAIADFNRVILLDGRWVPAYVYRGLAHMNRGEYAEALSDYTTALNFKADDPTVHNNLAWLYATAKDEKFRDTGKALEHAKKAAELSKESNAEILDTLASAYFINGNVKEALEAEKKALKLEPENKTYQEKSAVFEKSMRPLDSMKGSQGQERK